MKLLLIWPNSLNEILGWGDLGAVAEPLALEYLAAGVKAQGHDVRLLDLRLHPDQLAETTRAFRPDVVGVTAFSMHVRSALAALRVVRGIAPASVTVVGGHHATLLPEDFFVPEVDNVVCGEGVGALCTLISAIARGSDEPVPGVWRRSGEQFRFGGDPPPFDVDALPMPDRSVTAGDRHRYFIDWMEPVALVRTTVGCPYRCTFCSLWQIMGGRYHMRDIVDVAEEISGISEPFVFLVDDEAFIHRRRMESLARLLATRGLRKRYFAYCRIDTLLRHRDVIELWREIGLERLFIGIDAISQDQLDDFRKKTTVSQIEAGLEAAADLGIEVFAQFVVPLDATRQYFRQLVRFIEHHRIDYPSFTVLTPLPGTELLPDFDRIVERQPNGRPNWDLFDCQNAVEATALPAAEFRREYRNLYRVFKGAYSQYREHNELLSDHEHDGLVGERTLGLRERVRTA